MARHRAQMDSRREGWGRNCLCSFQPHLVYLLEWSLVARYCSCSEVRRDVCLDLEQRDRPDTLRQSIEHWILLR
jgi:hypothetical protein